TTFADSSALLKLYVDEEGHEPIRRLGALVVADVARLEVPAALWRKHRLGELTASDARLLTADFEADWFGTDEEPPRFLAIALTASFSSGVATRARMWRWWPPIVTSTSGLSRRLRYHVGWRSSPPYDATRTTVSPSCTGDVSIVVRRLPLFRPVVVSMTTGMRITRPPTRPPLAVNTARWIPVTSRAAASL